MELAPERDLKTGQSLWQKGRAPPVGHDRYDSNFRPDAVVVGTGISGALMADALQQAGLSIVAVDRRQPMTGSSPASTALLMAELDTPLTKLVRKVGLKAAAQVWLRSAGAVQALGNRISDLGIDCDYRGIDLSPEMIALARRRFPKRSFEVANLLEQEPPFERCDYVLASGIFYLRREAPEEYLRSMIECMFAHCTRGVAFNSLSAWGEELAFDDEFRADPYLTLVTASSITERLALRHDYHPRDFTIFMHRAGAK